MTWFDFWMATNKELSELFKTKTCQNYNNDNILSDLVKFSYEIKVGVGGRSSGSSRSGSRSESSSNRIRDVSKQVISKTIELSKKLVDIASERAESLQREMENIPDRLPTELAHIERLVEQQRSEIEPILSSIAADLVKEDLKRLEEMERKYNLKT